MVTDTADFSVLRALPEPEPGPEPIPEPGPEPAPGTPITAVRLTYHHYIQAAGSRNIILILSYDGSESIVGQPIIGVMEVLGALGIQIKMDEDEWLGRTFDNLPLYTNISGSDSRVTVRYWFENSAGQRISPVGEQTIPFGTTSGTFGPLGSTSPSQPALVRIIYWHYRPLAGGDYQIGVAFTYATDPAINGQTLHPKMDIFEVGTNNPMRGTVGLSPGVQADSSRDSSFLLKTGAGTLSSPNPTSVDVEVYLVDDAGQVISNRDRRTVDTEDLFP